MPLKQLLRQTETRLSRAEQRSDQAERRLELSERNRQEAEDRQIDQCLRNTRAEHAILNLQVVTEQLQSSTTYLWIKRVFPRVRTWAEAVRIACAQPWETELPAAVEQVEVDPSDADRTTEYAESLIPFTKRDADDTPTRRAAA